MVQKYLLKWTGRTLKRIKSLLVLFLKYGRKMVIANLYSFPYPGAPSKPFPKANHLPPYEVEQFSKPPPSSRHIGNSLNVYLFLEFEP